MKPIAHRRIFFWEMLLLLVVKKGHVEAKGTGPAEEWK